MFAHARGAADRSLDRSHGRLAHRQWPLDVWLVVLDNNVYVRLGTKAADRVKANTTGMVLPVEIGGRRFDKVRLIDAPDAQMAVGLKVDELSGLL